MVNIGHAIIVPGVFGDSSGHTFWTFSSSHRRVVVFLNPLKSIIDTVATTTAAPRLIINYKRERDRRDLNEVAI